MFPGSVMYTILCKTYKVCCCLHLLNEGMLDTFSNHSKICHQTKIAVSTHDNLTREGSSIKVRDLELPLEIPHLARGMILAVHHSTFNHLTLTTLAKGHLCSALTQFLEKKNTNGKRIRFRRDEKCWYSSIFHSRLKHIIV